MNYAILGIGTPCVDHILRVSYEYLNSLPGEKEGMESVDYETFRNIVHNSGVDPILVAGGSCFNAIKGLSHLGKKCAIYGKIGNDSVAQHFFQMVNDHNITSLLIEIEGPTTQVACLVDPEGRRTCRDYMGAGKTFHADDLNPFYFRGVKHVHIEGYTLYNGLLTEKAMELSKEAGATISFDVSSFEVVETFKSKIISLIEKYVDLLFANQKEMYALTEKSSEEAGCELLQDICPVVVAMAGKDGCFVANRGKAIHYPAFQVHAIDTTGAGDLFASGFIYNYLQGAPMKECAHLGTLLAAEVVQILGAEIPLDIWKKIRRKIGIKELI